MQKTQEVQIMTSYYNVHPLYDIKIRCKECHGSGELLGSGMIRVDCEHCDGEGWFDKDTDSSESIKVIPSAKKVIKLDRRGHDYKTAIRKIMELHPDITRKEAESIFEQEYQKL